MGFVAIKTIQVYEFCSFSPVSLAVCPASETGEKERSQCRQQRAKPCNQGSTSDHNPQKEATTHWGAAEVFRQLFPKVDLKPEKLIVDAGGLYSAGAFTACYDLSLYLVAKYVGYNVAAETAKTLIHDIGRISQTHTGLRPTEYRNKFQRKWNFGV